jgi:pimeloyl-ACP methyl ester carboxylesterase
VLVATEIPGHLGESPRETLGFRRIEMIEDQALHIVGMNGGHLFQPPKPRCGQGDLSRRRGNRRAPRASDPRRPTGSVVSERIVMMDESVVTLSDISLPGRAGDDAFHLATYQAGSGPAVVFCHGFPDLAMGWQHQLPAVAAAGFHAIAADGRGYGGSSCPHAIDAYTMTELTGDLVALLDKLDIDKAVFVGHDWGGWVVWAMAILHPTRVAGVAAACTPYIPFPSLQKHIDLVEGDIERQYVAWFQEDGTPEAYMDQHVETIVRNTLRTSAPLAEIHAAAFADGKLNMNPFWNIENAPVTGNPLPSETDIERYIEQFTRTGFRGGINWYRNIDRNAADHPGVGIDPIDAPCLMLTAELDPALRPSFAEGMEDRCSDLEIHLIENAGHWVQQEQAEVFNDHLVRWLQRNF